MTLPIDPIRRAGPTRRTRRSDDPILGADEAEDRSLPVVIEAPAAAGVPPAGPTATAEAVFAAQLLGQEGQKRGLRGGPPVLDAARTSYAKTEWSGPADRRARAGRRTKTDI